MFQFLDVINTLVYKFAILIASHYLWYLAYSIELKHLA